MNRFGQIIATGAYLPEHEVTNDELRRRFAATAPGSSTRWRRAPGSAAASTRRRTGRPPISPCPPPARPWSAPAAGPRSKAKAGDLVVLVGSGVGYNQAGAAFRLTASS